MKEGWSQTAIDPETGLEYELEPEERVGFTRIVDRRQLLGRIAQLRAQGRTFPQIAAELGITRGQAKYGGHQSH